MAEKNFIEQAFDPELQPEIVPVGEVSSSATIKELATALVDFQAEAPNILKRARAEGGGRGGWNYAPLSVVRKVLQPLMAKHGLAVVQFTASMPSLTNFCVGVSSRVIHRSGQWMQGPAFFLPVVGPKGNPSQLAIDGGSGVMYARRYSYESILGVVATKDDDGVSASGLTNATQETNQATNAEACPQCGKALKLRAGKRGDFYGCSGYPNCKYTRDATSQPQPESPGTVVPPPEAAAVDEPERKKLRAALKQAGNAAGMDDAALSVWIKGMGRNTATCSVEDINGLINLIPAISKQYKDWLALTDGMKDSGNIVNILNADATHFLQLRTDDREAALTQARLKSAKEVPY